MKRKEKVEKLRIKHDKKMFVFVVSLVILIIILVFLISKNQTENNLCKVDSDCVKQQTTCCSCSMGGEERCMTKREARLEQRKLEKCEENLLCVALYNCREMNCKCVDGKCIEE